MRLEVKNVKRLAALSQETDCFSATLYADGQKLAVVTNEGHGDPNHYAFCEGADPEAFYAYCRSLPPCETPWGTVDSNEDIVVEDLVGRVKMAKKFTRMCKKETLFRLHGDERGAWRTMSKATPAAIEYVRAKYGDKVECIANEDIAAAIEFC